MSMMVVDDDSLVTTLMSLSLDELGWHDVIAEDSGYGALARLDAGDVPSVIFCDLQMPGMDGVELLRHLAGRQYHGGVVLLSGSDWRIVKACEQMGKSAGLNVLGHLKKPFTNAEITKLLSTATAVLRDSRRSADPITESELREALRLGQIVAWYQPQVETSSRQVVGMEALARWAHPQRGFVPPLAFISLAEEVGLIDDVTRRVAQDALQHLAIWRAQGMRIRMSINLSASNLNDRSLPEQMAEWCDHAGADPKDVRLEITESQLATNLVLAQEVGSRLRLKGLGLAIDDFGTGYSSLVQLNQLPFNELKIDRAFVHGAARDASCRAIFESNVNLARKLEMTSVAEGIETEEDFALARELGCDVAQGYLFSAALPAAELQHWVMTAS